MANDEDDEDDLAGIRQGAAVWTAGRAQKVAGQDQTASDGSSPPRPKLIAGVVATLIGVVVAVIAGVVARSSFLGRLGNTVGSPTRKDQNATEDRAADGPGATVSGATVPEKTNLNLGEAAALIGVVAAVIAGSIIALGTVAHLAYYNALGFDAHLFPPLGSELHVVGMVSAILPALFVGVVALAYACLFALIDRAEGWLSRHQPPAKWRTPIALAGMAVAAAAFFIQPATTTTQWILGAIFVGVIILAGNLFGKWVAPVVTSLFVGGVMLALVIKYVTGQAYEAGKDRATAAGKSNATTIVELTDGSKITVQGDRIVCSERFCGFHDGKTATVISLEDVRRIQSPGPQEQPPQTSDK